MSIRVQAELWSSSKQAGTALLLLLAIADFADDEGRAYPSVSTLAQKIRSSTRNTQLLLKKLKDSGELTIVYGSGPRGCNRYQVLMGVKPTSGVKVTSGGNSLRYPLKFWVLRG